MDYLALYSSRCKRCGHLDPDEPKRYTKCHYDVNPDCPAKEVQLAVVGQAKRIAKQFKRAVQAGDFKTQAAITAKVASSTEAFQQKFKDAT